MRLNYKVREISTKAIYDAFDPPLIFKIKHRAPNGWLDIAEALEENRIRDVPSAIKMLNALCVSVSDGEEVQSLATLESAEAFYQMLQGGNPEMAAEILCHLAYNLALDYIREKKAELKRLTGPSELSANGNNEKAAVLES